MPKVKRIQRVTSSKGTSQYERDVTVKWRDLTKREFLRIIRIPATVAGVCGAIVLASLPDGPVDMWGDFGTKRTPEEIHKMKLSQRRAIMSRTHDPVDRFALSYIGTPDGMRDAYISFNGIEGNSGVLGMLHSLSAFGQLDSEYGAAGDTCLAGTSYDTTPSRLYAGDINAVASMDVDTIDEEQVFFVHPAATEGDSLSFIVDGDGFLTPFDEATKDVLAAYGCDNNLND